MDGIGSLWHGREMRMKKRIVVVDDHASIRDMLVCVLMRDPAYEVVGAAGNGLEAINLCSKYRPDLLILDLLLPRLCGTEVLRRVRNEIPKTRVLIYSGTANPALMKEALLGMPHGYVEKGEGLASLRRAIETVVGGGSYYSGTVSGMICGLAEGGRLDEDLSRREREVVQLIAEGWSSKEISSLLNLATKTVENHRANLMLKLNLHDVAGITRYAARRGMLALD